MSYINNIQTTYADSPNLDAFARLRTSNTTTLFDSKQLYDTGSLYWDTRIVGNATASFVQGGAAVSMSAVGNPSSVLRQTKRYFQYQPGKSHLIITTANLKDGAGTAGIKRVGYYDDSNGLYYTVSGSSVGTVLRKNGVDTFTSQSSWNLDKMDGTGTSGKTLDTTKSQIYFIDAEWLGVGRVRYGIFQAGIPTYVHEITNVNSLTDVYMSNPNLPVRFEIINSGSGAQSMLHICSTVASEGGYDNTGIVRTVDHIATTNAVAGNTEAGIVAIRLLNTGSTAFPIKVSALNTSGNNNFAYALYFNPVTGSSWVWQSIPNSNIQWATGSVALTNTSTKVLGGYVSSTSDFADTLTLNTTLGLGNTIAGESDTFVLAVRNLGGTSQNFVGSMTFQERN
jgi:hypothetical protein